jgi:hypothetical protein
VSIGHIKYFVTVVVQFLLLLRVTGCYPQLHILILQIPIFLLNGHVSTMYKLTRRGGTDQNANVGLQAENML